MVLSHNSSHQALAIKHLPSVFMKFISSGELMWMEFYVSVFFKNFVLYLDTYHRIVGIGALFLVILGLTSKYVCIAVYSFIH